MSANIIIVDEKDNVIGVKKRNEIIQEDIYRVSALWITNSKGDHLLAQRAITKAHDPGKWGPAVAGTVEEGENYEMNILKEAEEEIGLKNVMFQLGPKARTAGDDGYNYFSQWYVFVLDRSEDEFVLQKEEVQKIKWFTNDELKKEIHTYPEKFVKTMKRWVCIFCKA